MSRIVITGGSSGLGAAIVAALAGKHEVLDFSLPLHNIRNLEDCKVFMAEACFYKEGQRSIDILINCAGVSPLEWIENVSEEEYISVLDTNVKGTFNMIQAALPYLSAKDDFGRRYKPFGGSEGGTILNICSTAAWTPMTCTGAYNTSKAAVHMMTLQMARELKPRHDIDVFGIAPNQLAGTGITNYVNARVPELRGWTPEDAEKKQKSLAPAGEATPPEAVAEFIAFLLQDKNHHKFLTGSIIPYGA